MNDIDYKEIHLYCPSCRAAITMTPSGAPKVEGNSNPHVQILMRAERIRKSREAAYKDIWKNYGWRGCLIHLRTCVERAFVSLWSAPPGATVKVDNILDAINYAAFAIRNIEEGNRDGTWVYPED